jgi:adenylosuccinate synthase
VCDLLLPEAELKGKIERIAGHKKKLFKALGIRDFDTSGIVEHLTEAAGKVRPYITDTQFLLNKATEEGKSVLLEGAQGAMLDIDHGTFPYVTSSNATAGAACTGTGLAPTKIERTVGIAKAYTTRVGGGPFPTELDDETGNLLREAGNEFGTTTGRPRRCGWLDLVLLKYTCMVNGVTEVVLTKLDVLDGLKEIKVCTAYEIDGKKTTDLPLDNPRFERAKPVYESLEGWDSKISASKKLDDLPKQARDYIKYVEERIGVPIKIVSVGPKRSETILPS